MGDAEVADERAQGEALLELFARGQALGAIALYELFDQKAGLSELDRQLFGLLESHAATALLSSRWMSGSPSFEGAGPGRTDRISN